MSRAQKELAGQNAPEECTGAGEMTAGAAGSVGSADAAWGVSVYVRNGRNGREKSRGRSRSMCPGLEAQHQMGLVRGRTR